MSKEFYIGKGKTATWPDFPPQFPPPASITYGDVLILPGTDTLVETRKQPDLSVQFGPYRLTKPIISAPMDTVSGERMVRKLAELGGVGSLPRNRDFNQTLALCEKLSTDGIPCLYSLGLNNAFDEAREVSERGGQAVLIDVANGGMESVKRTAGEIKSKLGLTIVAGNIVTYDQAEAYLKAGIDIGRVGVGPGGACTTRIVSGVGMPQLSAIFETTQNGLYIIADGGIKYPGDAAKALAAGASMVMLGSMLAGTEETPGEIIGGEKRFRGQASESYMVDNGTAPGEFRAAEGIDTRVPAKGSVVHVVDEITGGIRSAMAYVGVRTLEDFRKKAIFTFVSPSAQIESQPHVNRR